METCQQTAFQCTEPAVCILSWTSTDPTKRAYREEKSRTTRVKLCRGCGLGKFTRITAERDGYFRDTDTSPPEKIVLGPSLTSFQEKLDESRRATVDLTEEADQRDSDAESAC